AAGVKGVKEVVNSLTVAGMTVTPTVTSPAAPDSPRTATKAERVAIREKRPLPPPPPAPVAPSFRDVTVPAGTELPVRITETLDSETTQTGQRFNGVVTRQVVVGGLVVIPAGAPVSGTVVEAKDAGHFKGNSILSVAITSLSRHGRGMSITTDPYTVMGKGRGRNTAEKIGGGAAIGALVGGLLGGGKGAAIGAGAGAGGGTILQGATRGQQVVISSESVIRFRLANSFTVRTSETADDDAQDSSMMQRHSDGSTMMQRH
ncbi:MAG: BON domain-containing protein, partial [Bryocella sp.]